MKISDVRVRIAKKSDSKLKAIASVTFDSVEIALYSGIAVFVMTKVIDFILDGVKYEKAMFIITNKIKIVKSFYVK